MTDQEAFKQLRDGSEEILKTLYRKYRGEFGQWAMKKRDCSQEEALDAFQEGMIILYEKIQSGHITELRSTLKTLLFGIAKNRLYKHLPKEVKMTPEIHSGLPEEEVSTWGEWESNELAEQLARLVAKMKAPCDQILYFFYYRNFSMESIANRLGYSNERVAKTQKNRCMKRLRQMATGILD
ncbi:MAG: sigma-70 family RNA polymerase sigma factor [Bacteroidota bacterium]